MTNEERIAQLEGELANIKSVLADFGKMYEREAGESEAFRAAITALIAAHPDPDLLAAQMSEHTARPEAAAVFGHQTEERLDGLQSAQDYLAYVCNIAQKLRRTPE